MKHFSLEQTFNLIDQNYLFRKCVEKDLSDITRIYNQAYEMWRAEGFKLRNKEVAEIGAFFIPDGYIIESQGGKIIAGTCIRPFSPEFDKNWMIIERATTPNKGELIQNFPQDPSLSDSIYFYSLAVDPQFAKTGLGNKLFEVLLKQAKKQGFQHSFLETGKETWLVAWYERLGYQVIAEAPVPNSNLFTVIMHQKL